ncbi:uncharacterized protein LOC121049874 [Rosa chinensis]|uniref:uncharacterized protein LOC121049874 n=1 Tax=Rosa chinensis TaxID=74649 RepID=UPI001AD91538|nr:uncharacterized protein LOC121049874 [Rosa chinensis]
MKSKDMEMTMNNDELREMIDEINKDIEYMQLKSSEKLRRRCRHTLNKPFVSMKNNLCKLFQGDKSVMISWSKPGNGAFRLNVDGSKSNGGLIGAGGVLRDGSPVRSVTG